MHAEQPTRTAGTDGTGAPPLPLASYAVFATTFVTALGGALAAVDERRGLPQHIAVRDVALAGIATHKLSRLVTKDKVTTFARAPFAAYEGDKGYGEVRQQARGRGLRRALGELVSCPFCVAQWIAAGFTVGLVAAPRPTRVIASMYTAQALSDFLQLAYVAAQEQV